MPTPAIVVYEKPTCTTCRKLSALFAEEGIGFERVTDYVQPLSKRVLTAPRWPTRTYRSLTPGRPPRRDGMTRPGVA